MLCPGTESCFSGVMELIQSIVLRITIDKNNHSARAPRLRYITANDGTRIARMTRMRADQIILVPLKRRYPRYFHLDEYYFINHDNHANNPALSLSCCNTCGKEDADIITLGSRKCDNQMKRAYKFRV